MIFSLASVPRIYTGQELSAQDLNNLAQNTEILEQVVRGTDRLFLSNWKLAPPAFSLINQARQSGDSLTFIGSKRAQLISEVDVWEGSFVYREGMHTLRLGFQSYPIAEAGFGNLRGYQKFDNIKQDYNPNLKDKTTADITNDTVGLFLMIRYTDLPLNQIVAKHPKYVRRWAYSKIRAAASKQPTNTAGDVRPVYNMEDDVTYPEGAAFPLEVWNANPPVSAGYHQYTLDITDFGFVPGEVVNIKMKLATGDYKPVTNIGRRFYFSMVYANLGHELMDTDWTTVNTNSITSVNDFPRIANNQRALVDFFSKYDNPLRASLWDQVMVGTSYFPVFSRYDYAVFNNLADWGLNTWEDYLVLSFHASEARYYLPRQYDLKNTISISYNVAVNTFTAFSMQCQLSKSAVSPTSIRKETFWASNPTVPSFVYSFEGWPIKNRQPIGGYPHVVPAGWTNYKDPHFEPFQRATNNIFARLGIVNFMGTYSNTNPRSNVTTTVNTSILPEGLSTPAGYPNPREFLYMAGQRPTTQNSWHGFYFIRPGFLGDGGVPYYTALGGVLAGKEQSMFRGPKGDPEETTTAAYYVDNFDFVLKAQAARGGSDPVAADTMYYPVMYEEYTGIKTHEYYRYEKHNTLYTDFTVNLKESSYNWDERGKSYTTSSGTFYENSQGAIAFNKASYISTFRLAEVARKDSGFVRAPFGRFESFQLVSQADLVDFAKAINNKLNEIYNYIQKDDIFKYIPLFWNKPKSMLGRSEKLTLGERSQKTLFANMELGTVYFSSVRNADYLIVRGRGVSIGWGGFTRIYRDNPTNALFPAPLEISYVNSQSLTGDDIETVIVGFETLEGLAYGERYYIQGDVYYAAETMGVP
jgi:hypothetical protein